MVSAGVTASTEMLKPGEDSADESAEVPPENVFETVEACESVSTTTLTITMTLAGRNVSVTSSGLTPSAVPMFSRSVCCAVASKSLKSPETVRLVDTMSW